MMMVQYLLDAGTPLSIPGCAEPVNAFEDVVAPVAIALDQERRVSDQIAALTRDRARRGRLPVRAVQGAGSLKRADRRRKQATMSDLLHVVERCRDNVMLVEEYLAREHGGGDAEDPAAPPAAGGAL